MVAGDISSHQLTDIMWQTQFETAHCAQLLYPKNWFSIVDFTNSEAHYMFEHQL